MPRAQCKTSCGHRFDVQFSSENPGLTSLLLLAAPGSCQTVLPHYEPYQGINLIGTLPCVIFHNSSSWSPKNSWVGPVCSMRVEWFSKNETP